MWPGLGEHRPLMPNVQDRPYHRHRKRYIHFNSFQVDLRVANTFFAFITVTGQVGLSISLCLWITSTKSSKTKTVDGYFMYSFANMIFLLLFGFCLLFIRIFKPHYISETEKSFPQLKLFFIGFLGALNYVLLIVSEPQDKTSFPLQGILGCCLIPLTALLRFILMKKVPSLLRFISALVVFALTFVNFVPQLKNAPSSFETEQKGLEKYLWPLCFFSTFLTASLMMVIEEQGLKWENPADRKKQVNLVYFLFWASFYQFVVFIFFFWADIIPRFGNFSGATEFFESWKYSIQCFFGYEECTWHSGVRGTVFILMYFISYMGSSLLLRHAEGATYLAIVTSLATTLVTFFWTLFKESNFHWETKITDSLWWSAAAAFGMTVFIFIYNIGPPERIHKDYKTGYMYEEYIPDNIPSRDDPIRDLYQST